MTCTCAWDRNELFSYPQGTVSPQSQACQKINALTDLDLFAFRVEPHTSSLNAIIIIGLPAPAFGRWQTVSLQARLTLPSSPVCPMGRSVVIAGKG